MGQMKLIPANSNNNWRVRWIGRAVWRFDFHYQISSPFYLVFNFYEINLSPNKMLLDIHVDRIVNPEDYLKQWKSLLSGASTHFQETYFRRLLINANCDKIEAILTRLYPGILFIWDEK